MYGIFMKEGMILSGYMHDDHIYTTIELAQEALGNLKYEEDYEIKPLIIDIGA